ncbi:GTPase-activating protein GYP8 [Saccharomyces eubayanus]|uniref:GTPase-activating protein GYP8 n=1 Tax=Saccharomyces eubayanus TaxID=1080349 RepID=UPI0006C70DC8|nr:GYP8-like protein [Saccharomyces eubayanus]KOG99794.1 GYP8-like protein [Saccharomyces eubayanus]
MPLRSLLNAGRNRYVKDRLVEEGVDVYLQSLDSSSTEKADEQKGEAISRLLKKKDVRLLRHMGMGPLGFVSNSLRRDCWYELLTSQLHIDDATEYFLPVEKHKDEGQVALDAERSFGGIANKKLKVQLKALLVELITDILRKYPSLNYYQGYHDIVSVFIMCFSWDVTEEKGLEWGSLSLREQININKLFYCVEAFTLLYLRDFMMNSLDFSFEQLSLISLLIKESDPKFYNAFQFDKNEPLFAIGSILTIFAHNLKPIDSGDTNLHKTLFQIFDMTISSQSMHLPLIIYKNLLLQNAPEILKQIEANSEVFENDFDLRHGAIQTVLQKKLYDESLWEEVLQITRDHSANASRRVLKRVRLNKYSTLLNTACGNPSSFQMDAVVFYLDEQTKMNEQYKKNKHDGIATRSKTRALVQRLGHFLPPKYDKWGKISLLIGIVAILYQLRNTRSLSLVLSLRYMISTKLKDLSHVNMNLHNVNNVWMDPIKDILRFGRPNR